MSDSSYTNSDFSDFRAYCQQATQSQLGAIIEKETAAGRHACANIAAAIHEERAKP
ncbi:hypothetical protein [uncultured Pelagimonas sp.]|uniref:hypothetical protein n=1 Tax=uncultured Pelagimonas sp. TaxID=1618102 RepID=UPI00260FF2CA|nr:hypothetical protein [uncultured Pelagimonas sp.]